MHCKRPPFARYLSMPENEKFWPLLAERMAAGAFLVPKSEEGDVGRACELLATVLVYEGDTAGAAVSTLRSRPWFEQLLQRLRDLREENRGTYTEEKILLCLGMLEQRGTAQQNLMRESLYSDIRNKLVKGTTYCAAPDCSVAHDLLQCSRLVLH